LFWILLFME